MSAPGYAFEQTFWKSKRHVALALHHVIVGGLAIFSIVKNPNSASIVAPSAIGAIGLAQTGTAVTASQTDKAQAESEHFPLPAHMVAGPYPQPQAGAATLAEPPKFTPPPGTLQGDDTVNSTAGESAASAQGKIQLPKLN